MAGCLPVDFHVRWLLHRGQVRLPWLELGVQVCWLACLEPEASLAWALHVLHWWQVCLQWCLVLAD